MYNEHMKSKSGFTIVELLIVIVVIAVLAAVSTVAFNGIRGRAIESTVSSDLSNNLKKLKRFQIENNRWPSGDGEIANLGNVGYPMRISKASNYASHSLSSGGSRFASCYYNKTSANGWPGPANSEGMLLVGVTSTDKVFAGTTESMSVQDITPIYVSEATAGTNNIPCRSGAAAFSIYIGGINNIGPYVPAG